MMSQNHKSILIVPKALKQKVIIRKNWTFSRWMWIQPPSFKLCPYIIMHSEAQKSKSSKIKQNTLRVACNQILFLIIFMVCTFSNYRLPMRDSWGIHRKIMHIWNPPEFYLINNKLLCIKSISEENLWCKGALGNIMGFSLRLVLSFSRAIFLQWQFLC